MRFLHLADVHLDTPFAGRTETLRARFRQASRDAFGRALDDAITHEVDAVLIAGDFFDGSRLSFETERFLVRELGRLAEAGIAVVYATGNHDPGRVGPRAQELEWPNHVTVAGQREPRRIPVRRGDRVVGHVTAAGHESERETVDLARTFPRPPDDGPEVALLHTQVHAARAADEHDAYAPSDLEVLRRAGYDYWALGHVHTRQALSHDPPIHYPGNLQGRTPRETGPRGGLLVDLSEPSDARIDFRPYAPIRWEDVEVDGLEEADTLERLVATIRAAWTRDRAAEDADPGADWVVRVILRGPTPLWRELASTEERRVVADEVAGRLGALDVTVVAPTVHPVVPVEEHRRREDVLGEALRLVERVRAGQAELPLDPQELAGVEGGPGDGARSYVESLLDGAEGEILARLLRQDG